LYLFFDTTVSGNVFLRLIGHRKKQKKMKWKERLFSEWLLRLMRVERKKDAGGQMKHWLDERDHPFYCEIRSSLGGGGQ